jgi:monoamine oxidase
MSKTRLFGRLRGIAQRAFANERVNAPSTGASPRFTRRSALLGAGSLATLSLPACGSDDKKSDGESIAVVGAGIAGLHCAYRLKQAGVAVTVYEASSRVGGRMFTASNEYGDGQVFELGGELIDSNHETLLALAEEFDIALDDRWPDEADGLQIDVWFVAGAAVPEATVVEQFTAVASAMADAKLAADNEDDDTAFVMLDNTPLSDWLDENVPPATYPELHAILTAAYRGEFGLETTEQSALNMLYLIGSDEPEPFRIFGESDERYHAHLGSNIFPTKLAEQLGSAVELDSQLVSLKGDSDAGFTLTFKNPKTGATRTLEAPRVVLAIPFSVLRKVALDVPLSDLKKQIIDELGYGTNAKIMGSFESRVWRDDSASIGSVTSDLPLQQVWDTSIGQAGEHGLLTNFLGGEAGVAAGEGEAEAYFTGILPDLELVFPGVSAAYRANTARRMHWPTHPYTLGSYTCYRPGQWSFWQQEGAREGNLHFCGEHTSADFQGWMEGGAETGAAVAAEILVDLEITPEPRHSALIARRQRLGVPERLRRLHAEARWLKTAQSR